jgi:hypothetical protein
MASALRKRLPTSSRVRAVFVLVRTQCAPRGDFRRFSTAPETPVESRAVAVSRRTRSHPWTRRSSAHMLGVSRSSSSDIPQPSRCASTAGRSLSARHLARLRATPRVSDGPERRRCNDLESVDGCLPPRATSSTNPDQRSVMPPEGVAHFATRTHPSRRAMSGVHGLGRCWSTPMCGASRGASPVWLGAFWRGLKAALQLS